MSEENTNCTNCSSCRGCDGCYGCYACSGCNGCDACRGCNGCEGCSACNGCDGCRGCYACSGCYACEGCRGCNGCNGCEGCSWSFGLKNCKAVYKSVFTEGLAGDKFQCFGKDISEQRAIEIIDKLRGFNWYPSQTNAFELYTKAGSQWSKIDINKLTYKEWSESWEDMPKEMLGYITLLPEFDAVIFKEITGIDVEQADDATEEAMKLLKEKGYKIVKE